MCKIFTRTFPLPSLPRTSGVNMEAYTSSSSLVIRNDGRTVRSIPGTAPTQVLNHHRRPISYSEEQLPLSVYSSPTLVISEDTRQAYDTAFNSSNAPVTLLSPLTGDDLPNEMCNSRNTNRQKLRNKISQHSFPGEPNSFQPDFSASASSEVYNFGRIDMDIGASSEGSSHMVTGLGGGVGAGGGGGGMLDDDIFQLMDQMDPLLPQCDPVPVFEDDANISDLLRKLEESPHSCAPSDLVILPDLEVFQAIDSSFLSATICSDYMGEPVQVRQEMIPESHSWNQSSESGTVEDDLVIIKMMSSKPAPPQSLRLQPHMEEEQERDSHIAAAMSAPVKLEFVSPSPAQNGPFTPCPPTPLSATPYGFQPQTPMAPVQVSAPSPGPPSTPMTPATPCPPSRKGPFEMRSYKDADNRVLDVGINYDNPDETKKMAYEMNCFSLERCILYEECMSKAFDLNMAINARAKMCKFNFDRGTGMLTLTMPKDCK